MPIDKFGRELYRSYVDEDIIEEKVKNIVQQKTAGLVQQRPIYFKSTLRLWCTNKIKFKKNTVQFLLFNFLERYTCPIDCKIVDISIFEHTGVNPPFSIYINKNVFNDINNLVGVVLNKGDVISCDFPQTAVSRAQMGFFLELVIEVPI